MNVLQIVTMYEVQDRHLLGEQNFPLLMAMKHLGQRKTAKVPLCLTPWRQPLCMP